MMGNEKETRAFFVGYEHALLMLLNKMRHGQNISESTIERLVIKIREQHLLQ